MHIEIVRDYNNKNQYEQLDNWDFVSFKIKSNFYDSLLFLNEDIIKSIFSFYSFVEEFYKIELKSNKKNANRLYIYQNGNKYTADLISEWNDKSKKETIRKIKDSIINTSFDGLRIFIHNINK